LDRLLKTDKTYSGLGRPVLDVCAPDGVGVEAGGAAVGAGVAEEDGASDATLKNTTSFFKRDILGVEFDPQQNQLFS
jgi:hypothetical protein